MSTPPSSMPETALAGRLRDIGEALHRWRPLWEAHAFREPVPAWEAEYPDLSHRLRSLDLVQSMQLADDPVRLDVLLSDWFPVAHWSALEAIAVAPAGFPRALPPWVQRDVPGRKWEQITAFAAALQPGVEGRVVDWCAGKAHLARLLAHLYPRAEVLALERDSALVRAACELAVRDRVPVQAAVCDVMDSEVVAFLDAGAHLMALHACGALHRRLLDLGVACGARRIAVAPCCFHLGNEGYVPRSRTGRETDPGFRVADLRTAVQEVVTAGGHARRRRERLQSWQLGFDALLRALCGRVRYTPAPGASAALLAGSFADYCRHTAKLKRIALPDGIVFDHWEQRGRERFRDVSALDLVRRRFRRLIELWLVLDLAVSLEEAGYAVTVGQFCAARISPRNLLLQATRVA